MKVENLTKAIINIDGKIILPSQHEVIGDEWADNPVVKAYEAEKMIKITKATAKVVNRSLDDMVADLANLSAESTKTKLNAFAKKYDVNIDGAETPSDIYAVLFAFVDTAKKNAE